MLGKIRLQGFEHNFEGIEDIDVEGIQHPVGAGLRIELVHPTGRRDRIGAAVLPPLGGTERLDMVEDVQVHIVLHIVKRFPDRKRFCQGVGQDSVVAVIFHTVQVIRIDQPGQQRRTERPKHVNLLMIHSFLCEYTFI